MMLRTLIVCCESDSLQTFGDGICRQCVIASLAFWRTKTEAVGADTFGSLNMSTDLFFTLRANAHLRGLPYTLDKQRCSLLTLLDNPFFVIGLWVGLCGTNCHADFPSFQIIRKSLSNDYLSQVCKVYFNWWLLLCRSLMVVYVLFIAAISLIIFCFTINMSVAIWPFVVVNT